MTRDVEGPVDEAGDVGGALLGDHALQLVANDRTEDPEIGYDVLKVSQIRTETFKH